MRVAAGSLTINPAFLQEIKEDNRELRQKLQDAETVFSQAASALSQGAAGSHGPWGAEQAHIPLKKTCELLGELRDQLAIHFSLEESYGYFENAVESAPRLSSQAFALRAEHETLFRHVCALVEKAERLLYGEQAAGGVGRLAGAWRAFHMEFQRHEERERELILAAFDDDLGGGD